jgi:hypothetical protein
MLWALGSKCQIVAQKLKAMVKHVGQPLGSVVPLNVDLVVNTRSCLCDFYQHFLKSRIGLVQGLFKRPMNMGVVSVCTPPQKGRRSDSVASLGAPPLVPAAIDSVEKQFTPTKNLVKAWMMSIRTMGHGERECVGPVGKTP